MKQPSRSTYHHNCQHQTVACGWEQMMIGSMSSSSSHGPDHESLLNLLYADNNNSVNIPDDNYGQNYGKILLSSDIANLDHYKTCMASSSDGGTYGLWSSHGMWWLEFWDRESPRFAVKTYTRGFLHIFVDLLIREIFIYIIYRLVKYHIFKLCGFWV